MSNKFGIDVPIVTQLTFESSEWSENETIKSFFCFHRIIPECIVYKPREYEKFEISLNLKHLSCIALRLACFDDLDNAYFKCERI